MTPENDFNAAAARPPAPQQLVAAVNRLNFKMVWNLLKRGVDVVEADRMMCRGEGAMQSRGFTTLGWAAHNGRKDIAHQLIKAGVDINGRDKEGCTPLMRATMNHRDKTIHFFVNRGASLEEKNHDGQTVYDIVEERKGWIKKIFYEAVDARQHFVQEERTARMAALHSVAVNRQKDLIARAHASKVIIKRIP